LQPTHNHELLMAPALGGSPPTSTDIVDAATSTTDAVASATATSSAPSGNNGLYLYTFMITLLVLFGVSLGIVTRSCIIRRRFRRQMAAAVEAGVVLPPRLNKKNVVIGEKPVLYEVWLDHPHGAGEKEWPVITPVSATILKSSAPPSDEPGRVIMTREFVSEYFGVDLRSVREMIRDFYRNSVANSRLMVETISQRSPANPVTPVSPATPESPRKVAVGLVIAMPNSTHPHYHPHPPPTPSFGSDPEPTSPVIRGKRRATDDAGLEDEYEGEELPDIVFGLVERSWVPEPPPPSQPPITK